jgi:hypothetical protein
MPLISPMLSVQIRRQWQLVAAVLVMLAFVAVHVLIFQPNQRRLEAALTRAADLGLALDPDRPAPVMPPRVLALVTDNALPAAAATESGALTATLLEDLTQLTTSHGMVVQATEPGVIVQESKATQVRAHLRIQCSFTQFVAFLDDLARSNRLIAVDRFALATTNTGRNEMDLWVTQYILKQTGGKRRSS